MKNRRLNICKLRCSNFRFPIETGRWNDTPKDERYCHLCVSGSIGNEYHYLFECTHQEIKNFRTRYIPNYFTENPSEVKMIGLISYCNGKVLNNLSIFLQKISKFL